MDREIDPQIRRRRHAKRVGFGLLAGGAAIGLLAGASSLLRASVSRDAITTARVSRGRIEATIQATGTVLPEIEQVLSSPLDARIVRVLRRSGAVLEKGDPILELDLSEPTLALERLKQDLALKENQQERTRLDLESTRSALSGRIEIKKLELQNLAGITARDKKLASEELVSAEELRLSELNESRAGVELRQLEESEPIAERATEAQIQGLELERSQIGRERREAERQLELATTRSDRRGVLTWVVPEEGATVRKGEVLARIADLTAFRVEATVSDAHAGRIVAGMPARVAASARMLTGSISRVLPTITNGVMTVDVRLDAPAEPELRPNLRVDVWFVTGTTDEVLTLKRGAFLTGGAGPELFVVRGAEAVKTPVVLGTAGLDAFDLVARHPSRLDAPAFAVRDGTVRFGRRIARKPTARTFFMSIPLLKGTS
jgi:HlyD family secretion protein